MADLRNLGERIRQQVQASLAAAGIAAPDAKPPVRPERSRPPTAERAKSAPPKVASAEEQMAILNMVQSGAISPEEAELLLRSLEI
jgi:hypothetical protein